MGISAAHRPPQTEADLEKATPRDADGDGWIYEGTPRKRFIGVASSVTLGSRVRATGHSGRQSVSQPKGITTGTVVAIRPTRFGDVDHKVRWDTHAGRELEENLTSGEIYRRGIHDAPDLNRKRAWDKNFTRDDKPRGELASRPKNVTLSASTRQSGDDEYEKLQFKDIPAGTVYYDVFGNLRVKLDFSSATNPGRTPLAERSDSAVYVPKGVQKARPRDGDGDGWIYEGTPNEKFVGVPFGPGLTYSGIVHAQVPRGEPFAGRHVADVHEVHEDGTATLSLHLDSDHPAVKDAIADGHISSPEEFEAITRVDMKRVKANNDTLPLKKPALRALEIQRRRIAAARRNRESAENRAAYLADRPSKLAEILPELAARDAERRHPARLRRERETPRNPIRW